MIVKVSKLGDAVKDVVCAEGATVEDVLDALGIEVGTDAIRVDGAEATLDTEVRDGSLVVVAKADKGG